MRTEAVQRCRGWPAETTTASPRAVGSYSSKRPSYVGGGTEGRQADTWLSIDSMICTVFERAIYIFLNNSV